MGRRPAIVKELAEAAVDANPKAATKTLARALCKQEPRIFTSIEQARHAVRGVRGANGKRKRRQATRIRPSEEAEECRQWGALLPAAAKSEFSWRELPEGIERWLILADLHIPYHNEEALSIAMKHANRNCDGVLILGDLLDCHQASSFCHDTRKRSFEQEIESVKQFLDVLETLKPKAIVWKGGNHEARLERYLMQRAPELWPTLAEFVSFRTVCGLDERGVLWIRPQDPIRHHMLALLHGSEWKGGFAPPVNPARGAYIRGGECCVVAHWHRSSSHDDPSLFRDVQCWSVGCLCDLHPDYCSINKWNHGFAYLTTGSQWNVENKRITNKEVHDA